MDAPHNSDWPFQPFASREKENIRLKRAEKYIVVEEHWACFDEQDEGGGLHNRVAECQSFYTEQNLQAKFYPMENT